MVKKSAHASNAKVMEQAVQARSFGSVDTELQGVMERIAQKEMARKKINDDIGAEVAMIKDRWGIPSSTTRQILRERRMSKEAYSQHMHSLDEMKRMIGLQLDLSLVQDTRDEELTIKENDPVKNAAKLATV